MDLESDGYKQLHFARSKHFGYKVAKALTTAPNAYGWLDLSWDTAKAKGKYLYTLEAIIANGINATQYPYDGYVVVSRRESHFAVSPIYGEMSYNALVSILDHMSDKGYIDQILGEKDLYTNVGRRTLYRLTQKMLDLIQQTLQQKPEELEQFNQKVGHAFTRIRKKGQPDKIIITDRDKEDAKHLHVINQAAEKHVWEGIQKPTYWKVNQINTQKIPVGGRIYTPQQWIKKEKRQNWKVDGKEMCEVDIQASHIQILYAFANKAKNTSITCDQDPYKITGLSQEDNRQVRPLVKYITNVMINATSKIGGIQAVCNAIIKSEEEENIHKAWMYAKSIKNKIKGLVDQWPATAGKTPREVAMSTTKSHVSHGKKKIPYIDAICMFLEDMNKEEIEIVSDKDGTSTRQRPAMAGTEQDTEQYTINNPHVQYTTGVEGGGGRPRDQYREDILFICSGISYLVEMISHQHPHIKEYWGTGIGIDCMSAEGDIALHVLKQCAAGGIPVINIHDGFMTTLDHADTVSALIKEALRQRGISAHIDIKQKSAQASTVIWSRPPTLATKLADTPTAPSREAPPTSTTQIKEIRPSITQCINDAKPTTNATPAYTGLNSESNIPSIDISLNESQGSYPAIVPKPHIGPALISIADLRAAGIDLEGPNIDWELMDF